MIARYGNLVVGLPMLGLAAWHLADGETARALAWLALGLANCALWVHRRPRAGKGAGTAS